MLVYFSYPYSVKSRDATRTALLDLQRIIGLYALESPRSYGVNALFNDYGGALSEDAVYPQAGLLIKASNAVAVVRAKGWEYSEIIMQELMYATAIGKPIQYIDP